MSLVGQCSGTSSPVGSRRRASRLPGRRQSSSQSAVMNSARLASTPALRAPATPVPVKSQVAHLRHPRAHTLRLILGGVVNHDYFHVAAGSQRALDRAGQQRSTVEGGDDDGDAGQLLLSGICSEADVSGAGMSSAGRANRRRCASSLLTRVLQCRQAQVRATTGRL